MKAVSRWLARVAAGVVTVILVVLLLPHASRLASLVIDRTNRAQTISQILSQRFEESARLETLKVEEDGVLTSSTSALFLGTVRTVTIHYRYEASIGIDLLEVDIALDDNALTLILPPPEVLSDSLTPQRIDRSDFWYPLTDKQRAVLLENERLACRQRHLTEYVQSADTWEQTCRMLDATIAQWLGGATGLKITYERAQPQP